MYTISLSLSCLNAVEDDDDDNNSSNDDDRVDGDDHVDCDGVMLIRK